MKKYVCWLKRFAYRNSQGWIMPRKRKKMFINFITASILLIAVAIPLAAEWASFMRHPLGPSLALPTRPVLVNLTKAASLPFTASTPQAAPVIAQAPAQQPLCGGPAVMNILAIGSDYRYNTYIYGLSDVITMVRVDFVRLKVTLLDFPRDLYVEIPDISQHGGITHGKLNQPFLYGNPGLGYYDGPGQGPGLLARTLMLNYGERPDHYIAVNMIVFAKLIDAVGGVDIDLPEWVLGHSPGIHHMNGAQVLEFSRARPNGTFERTKQQDYVLAALWNKLRDPAVVAHTASIISAFNGSVETDLSPEEINQLTCIAQKIPREKFKLLRWPEGMFKGTRVNDPVLGYTFIWDVNNDLMRAYVAAFDNDEWPETSPTDATIGSTPAAVAP